MKKRVILLAVIIIALILVGVYISNSSSTDEMNMNNQENTDLSITGEDISSELEDGAYNLDTERSKITWTGRREILESEHTGTFNISSGSLLVSGGSVQEGEFVIDMASLEDDGSGVGTHLMSDDFFSVKKYPESKFIMGEIENGLVVGDLTMTGNTETISFPVQIVKTTEGVYFASAKFDLDRTKWGVTWGSGSFFDGLGDKAISNIANIEIHLYTLPSR